MDDNKTSALTETASQEEKQATELVVIPSSPRAGTCGLPVPRTVGGLSWGLLITAPQEGGCVSLGCFQLWSLRPLQDSGALPFLLWGPGTCF